MSEIALVQYIIMLRLDYLILDTKILPIGTSRLISCRYEVFFLGVNLVNGLMVVILHPIGCRLVGPLIRFP
jgi:hypothetical protein